ncbi:MAG: 2-C-methyl-D-erythritol 4-phosphate cytidylyltransferase [Elusimicrobiaceae bacterium]|jgi:2-C-methyl-D-erythritol 4-phosphate cytidylyltransferase / 2-C-methyl-D-erythritol 2,4-cyclodiphosphate synthase|nr:2-C-methyl-D-erythritol 4-phosphate cytidylyltransferase [Elusimicrobiaceae bacterium]MBT3955347.1 2-C-methyl-D-erythritol 4-phosphate cytidylyltransferase [Elusimicrobiaceae bacterium]MBT4008483.1 2-C-methyl-D-erythritol 4-phosphate cytidylyltransferase [Elusimicrobiaceae bacterium]MBT4403371.1 2-C-methyl-D-erythritol 4-phosphate cytidylyltransferase [Elusimicrobiaceae bacterium]MBT4440212.1 2-C-methyl-D-erythritol 4-phosphate cytidylyltransferase [Elusimicrobiaceae bacterium]
MVDRKFTSVLILAGGTGTRMGKPKQMLKIAGEPILFKTIKAFLNIKEVDEILLACNKNIAKKVKAKFKNIKICEDGATRLKSLQNGMKIVSSKCKLIAIHDSARPLIEKKDVLAVLKTASKYKAAVLGVPVKNTVKETQKGVVKKTLNRAFLHEIYTPQCYEIKTLQKALNKFKNDKKSTDDSSLVEKLGTKIKIVKGSYKNIKITTSEDLLLAEALLSKGASKVSKTRVGLGFDLHRMEKGRKFIVGGHEIKHTKGLLGHSDGDVVLHAVCDAVLGAICAGEIGLYYPPTDITIMGISSVVIAEKVMEVLKSKRARIVHMDITLIAEEPKISPHYTAVRKSLSEIFKLNINEVSFKAKSYEHVGAIGNAKACSAHAVVTVEVK